MYSAYKVNKQGDCSLDVLLSQFRTPFPVVPQLVLTVASLSAYRFLWRQVCWVVWYSHLFKNFPQIVVIHTVKGCSTVDETVVDVFLGRSFFFYDPTEVGNLISGSSVFSKSRLNI